MAHEHDHGGASTATAVIEVGGMQWASEKKVVESLLRRRPGVVDVDPNPLPAMAERRPLLTAA